MKRKIIILFLCLAGSSLLLGVPQVKFLTGTVTDGSSGEPLPGVNVRIDGSTTGTSTDSEGKFSLSAPAPGAIIVFSFIGYSEERVAYSGQTILDMEMNQAVTALDDVVVIGYGTIKKSDLTGSVASVSKKEIEKTSPVNITDALQGRVAGMMVTSVSGAPGMNDVLRIRGIGTVNNNDPIFVIDGTIIDNTNPYDLASNIRFLNTWDIESIEVLKDASAQAIYGSRGANGVILITTKKGSEGMPKVSFNATTGFANIARMPEVLNASEFRDYIMTSHYNGYMRSVSNPDPDIAPETINLTTQQVADEYETGIYTDWLDEVVEENVLNQNYYLSISGGSKYAHYSASAGYLNDQGIIRNYNYKRHSFRLNTDYNLGKNITVGENLGIASDIKKGNDDNANLFLYATAADPLVPVLKPEGSVDPSDPEYIFKKYNVSGINSSNPVLLTELINRKISVFTIVGNIFTEARLLKYFKLRSSYGFNIVYRDYSDFSPRYDVASSWSNNVSTVKASYGRTNGWIWENTLTYSRTIKDHSVTAMAGLTSESVRSDLTNASKEDTPNNDPRMRTFDAAATNPTLTGTYYINNMASYLGRIFYSYKGRYMLTASLRHDGSSKFGPGHRWGTFPSFSIGWNIGSENFYKNLGIKFISNIKLRTGWGQIGNTSLPVYYGYISQVGSGRTDGWVDNRYIFGENVFTGYFLKTIGNPVISWETTEQTNIGLDMILFDNSLNITAEYFIKNTKDMLLLEPRPDYSGYPLSGRPYTNAGSMQNKGFEFLAEYRKEIGNFHYSVLLNAATFKNKVTDIGGNKALSFARVRVEKGYPAYSFYGYVTDGIFQTEEEVQEHKGPEGTILQPKAHAGDFRFRNLNNDEIINLSDQIIIGNQLPELTYGINLNIGYKMFDLLLFAQGSYGNELVFSLTPGKGTGNILKYFYGNDWKGTGTSDTQPIFSSVDDNDNYRFSDYFVSDASYMRVKNLQIGYSLPEELLKKLKLTSCRIWVGGTNLFTITKYIGFDPEVGAAPTSGSGVGVDPGNLFPQTKEYQVGIITAF